MKRYWFLAAFGFVVLAFAAVWLGALNQDEGWYLYAAQLVSEGKVPYRDFFYTQAPVMPIVYAAFNSVWDSFGLLGARIVTICFGAAGVAFFCALAARLVPRGRRSIAALAVFLLLGSNLYHLYFVAIPKTYSLASLFVAIGFFLLTFARPPSVRGAVFAFASGLSLAFACGTRISLGVLLAVVGIGLLVSLRSWCRTFLWFGLGGALGLAVVYGFFLCDPSARSGLLAAQAYHAARGGFDPVFTVGSVSRLVRWYLPVFVLLGLGFARGRETDGSGDALLVARLAFAGFLAVFLVQMLAPFPYEDYQVPVMGLLAVFAVVVFFGRPASVPARGLLLTLGLAWAATFGSPLLEQWMTNGQDRFWTLKKDHRGGGSQRRHAPYPGPLPRHRDRAQSSGGAGDGAVQHALRRGVAQAPLVRAVQNRRALWLFVRHRPAALRRSPGRAADGILEASQEGLRSRDEGGRVRAERHCAPHTQAQSRQD